MEPLPEADSGPELTETYMADLKRTVPVLDRKSLATGYEKDGPAIVIEKVATSWIAPGWRMRVDDWGNLRLNRNA